MESDKQSDGLAGNLSLLLYNMNDYKKEKLNTIWENSTCVVQIPMYFEFLST